MASTTKTTTTKTKTTKGTTKDDALKSALKRAKDLSPEAQARLKAELDSKGEQQDIDLILELAEKDPEAKKALLAELSKQKKKEKDPNAPKKPLSSFMVFLNTNGNRTKMVAELVATGLTEKEAQKQVPTFAGDRWNNMSDAEQKPYLDIADKDKKRYESEMASYVPASGTPQKKSRKKVAGAPKGVRSAYLGYVTPRRAVIKQGLIDNEGMDGKAAQKVAWAQAIAEWHAISEEEKRPYIDAAEADKQRYKTEMAAWKAGGNAGDAEPAEDGDSSSGESEKNVPQKKRERPAAEKTPAQTQKAPATPSSGAPKVQVASKKSAAAPASSGKATATPTSAKQSAAKPPSKRVKSDNSE